MSTHRRILVPTDFSPGSEQALRYAYALCERDGAELHLIHVVQHNSIFISSAEPTIVPPVLSLDELREIAQSALAKIPEPAGRPPAAVTRDVMFGPPVESILRYAKDRDIDLICIGTHGRTGLPRAIIGSVAERVVQRANCSVLAVREVQHDVAAPDPGSLRIEKIIVPVDFNELTALLVEHASEIATKFGSEIHLLHVIEENPPARSDIAMAQPVVQEYRRELRRAADDHLARIAVPPGTAQHQVVRHIAVGRPFERIVAYAAEQAADFIVLGTHGRTGFRHWFLGSVAEMVVRKAPCPVLVMRPPA